MNRKVWIIIGVLIGLAPILISSMAYLFASINGCQLNEGSPNPCVVGGKDYANALYSLGALFWFVFITIPIGGVIAAIGFIKGSSSTNSVSSAPNVISPVEKNRPKRLMIIGLLLIFVPPILQATLSFIISALGASLFQVYALISIAGAIVAFGTLFCVPLGVVLLIVGVVKHFTAKKQ